MSETGDYRQKRCRHGWVDVSQCEACKTERELAAMRTTAAKAMADYETANHALANCKAVAEIQSERVRKLEIELAQMTTRAETAERERDRLFDENEMNAWKISPAMAQAKIDELNAKNEALTKERDALAKENAIKLDPAYCYWLSINDPKCATCTDEPYCNRVGRLPHPPKVQP